MNKEEFINQLKQENIFITPSQLEQLEKYYQLLIEWNEKINLTAITGKNDVYLKHFFDSLTLNKAIHLNTISSLCDIGTGAGFPGLVIKILYPEIEVTLVDALQKRVLFLKTVIEQLNLKKINVYHARAEEFAKTHREQYEVVTARAVANLSLLSEYCLPLVKCNYFFLPMKADVTVELETAKKAIPLLGGKLTFIYDFTLPNEGSHRTILKIQKCRPTPLKYPRKYSEMKKNPL